MDSISSEIKLRTILSQGWLYRGEGNSSIALSLPKRRQILRIKKCEKPKTILRWLFDWLLQIFKWEQKKDLEIEKVNLDFYNLVMVPLLGYTYAHPALNVSTSKNEIQMLDKEVLLYRPEYRKYKHLQYGTATLFPDYAFLPKQCDYLNVASVTYAVEIKPKQGWIPVKERHFDKCQFCLNQYLKLKNCQIKKLSSYCPLDLFSGNKQRMTKALKALIMNPQNNFRIFRDGIHYYGENVSMQILYNLLHNLFEPKENSINSLIDDFCDLLQQALLKKISKNYGCVNCDCNNNPLPHDTTYFSKVEQNKCNFTKPSLPLGCILEKILSLQQLNCMGLEKYCDIYKALIKSNFKFNNWSYVGSFLKEIGSNRICPKCFILKRANELKQITDKPTLSDVDLVPYLIAAVANDCSFMVTLKKVNKFGEKSDSFIIEVNNSSFIVNMGIFDLYPKPASTIEKHIKRNVKVQKAYKLMRSSTS